MIYTGTYQSPLGGILLAADEIGLTGLWFEGQKYFAHTLTGEQIPKETPVLAEAKKWLDLYFSGKEPNFIPPLHPAGSPFRQAVWKLLLEIPYGQTTTYGEIAGRLAAHAEHFFHVSPGRRRGGRPQRDFHYHSLPSRGGDKWQPDGLCRGN